MAHHAGPDEKMSDALSSLFNKQDAADEITALREHLGATGRHPQGALTEDDEGGINIGVTVAGGKVVMAFGKHIDWVGFDAEQARDLAQTFLDRAKECDGIEAHVRRVSSD